MKIISTKNIFYAALVMYAIANGIAATIAAHTSRQAYDANTAIFFLLGVPLPFIWYYLDAEERNFKRTASLKLVIVFLAIIGIPIYLFKSRGWKKGTVGSVIFILVIVGIVIISAITAVITSRIIS